MVTISRVSQSEIPATKELLGYIWKDTYGSFLPEEVIDTVTAAWHRPETLWAEAQHPNVYFGVARLATGAIAGLVTLRMLDDGETGFLSRLYVHPAYQRRGIGEALLQAATDAFPQIKQVRLEVEDQNSKGRAFYARRGFVQIGSKTEEVAGVALNTLVLVKNV